MFEQMTVEDAYKLTGTKTHAELGAWLGKARQVVRYYEKNGVPLSVEREIKMKLAAQKQERAEAKKLKGVHKID